MVLTGSVITHLFFTFVKYFLHEYRILRILDQYTTKEIKALYRLQIEPVAY